MHTQEDYFIRIENLVFEDNPENPALKLVQEWLPESTGIAAMLHNAVPGAQQQDYVIVADDAIYLAIIIERGGMKLRSIKCFKKCDIVATAIILEAMEDENPADAAQIRLMMSEGKRIQLIFSRNVFFDDLYCKVQELAVKPFFMA